MGVLKTIDLFAGVGGIRIGFEKHRFKTVYANDYDKFCKITYDAYHSSPTLDLGDVRDIESDSLPDFDLLLGGFPCQPFSIAGYQQGFNDEKGRGNLFFKIQEILEKRKPEAFLLENVKNLKGHDKGNTFKVISETLTALGYHFKSEILNSMDYGNVPQNRERVFIVGFKDPQIEQRFSFPNKIPLTRKVEELLDEEVEDKYYYNGKPLYEKLKDENMQWGTVYQWRRVYLRENKSGVCPTLTANMGGGGHNVPIIKDKKGIRKLTPIECARIQGFPDDFSFPDNVSDTQRYKQMGNSVSVPVIERIAEQIKNAFNR